MSIDSRLHAVVASVFGVNAARLSDADSPQTIAEWDSVAHLELVFALEAEFGIQFSADEMASLVNLGVIRERLTRAEK